LCEKNHILLYYTSVWVRSIYIVCKSLVESHLWNIIAALGFPELVRDLSRFNSFWFYYLCIASRWIESFADFQTLLCTVTYINNSDVLLEHIPHVLVTVIIMCYLLNFAAWRCMCLMFLTCHHLNKLCRTGQSISKIFGSCIMYIKLFFAKPYVCRISCQKQVVCLSPTNFFMSWEVWIVELGTCRVEMDTLGHRLHCSFWWTWLPCHIPGECATSNSPAIRTSCIDIFLILKSACILVDVIEYSLSRMSRDQTPYLLLTSSSLAAHVQHMVTMMRCLLQRILCR
jgi:hypothetical protein